MRKEGGPRGLGDLTPVPEYPGALQRSQLGRGWAVLMEGALNMVRSGFESCCPLPEHAKSKLHTSPVGLSPKMPAFSAVYSKIHIMCV